MIWNSRKARIILRSWLELEKLKKEIDNIN